MAKKKADSTTPVGHICIGPSGKVEQTVTWVLRGLSDGSGEQRKRDREAVLGLQARWAELLIEEAGKVGKVTPAKKRRLLLILRHAINEAFQRGQLSGMDQRSALHAQAQRGERAETAAKREAILQHLEEMPGPTKTDRIDQLADEYERNPARFGSEFHGITRGEIRHACYPQKPR